MAMQITDMLVQVHGPAAPVDPRPRLEAEMVEAARKVIIDALTHDPLEHWDGTGTIEFLPRVELAKWVVLNFWTRDE